MKETVIALRIHFILVFIEYLSYWLCCMYLGEDFFFDFFYANKVLASVVLYSLLFGGYLAGSFFSYKTVSKKSYISALMVSLALLAIIAIAFDFRQYISIYDTFYLNPLVVLLVGNIGFLTYWDYWDLRVYLLVVAVLSALLPSLLIAIGIFIRDRYNRARGQ